MGKVCGLTNSDVSRSIEHLMQIYLDFVFKKMGKDVTSIRASEIFPMNIHRNDEYKTGNPKNSTTFVYNV
jgi:hypothetical protein